MGSQLGHSAVLVSDFEQQRGWGLDQGAPNVLMLYGRAPEAMLGVWPICNQQAPSLKFGASAFKASRGPLL